VVNVFDVDPDHGLDQTVGSYPGGKELLDGHGPGVSSTNQFWP
jgi:hypothetical protein